PRNLHGPAAPCVCAQCSRGPAHQYRARFVSARDTRSAATPPVGDVLEQGDDNRAWPNLFRRPYEIRTTRDGKIAGPRARCLEAGNSWRMIAPPRWSEHELEEYRLRAIEAFRRQRMQEPLEDYLKVFDRYRAVMEDILKASADLAQLD